MERCFYNHNFNDFTLAFSYDINYGDIVSWFSPYNDISKAEYMFFISPNPATNIDISDLKQGIYLIHFDTRIVSIVKKFIKLR